MQQYILRRVLLNLLVIFFVATLVFLLLRIDTGFVITQRAQQTQVTDPAATEQARDLVRKDLGLDGSIFEQYRTYLWNLAQLDFGESFQAKEDVLSEIGDRIGPSLELGILQIIIALLVAVPIGIISAVRQDSVVDYVLRFVAIALLGIPVFVLGVFVLLLSSREFGYTPPLTTYRDLVGFPPFGTDKPVDVWTNLQIMAMPAIIGGLGTGAIIMRFLRSQMLEVMRQDYVRTARSKGLAESTVIVRHVMRNSLIPVITVLGGNLDAQLSGNRTHTPAHCSQIFSPAQQLLSVHSSHRGGLGAAYYTRDTSSRQFETIRDGQCVGNLVRSR
ncbi:MAG: ABC transporter permease [Chloroflexi bacterium]|nr:ABC transporter permease [Chloroflexota bacterium]